MSISCSLEIWALARAIRASSAAPCMANRSMLVKMPMIMTTDLRLNEPRYVKLPDVMKAKRKPMDKIELESLGLDTANRLTTLKVEEPEGRAAGVIVNSVSELVEKLRNEAKVI